MLVSLDSVETRNYDIDIDVDKAKEFLELYRYLRQREVNQRTVGRHAKAMFNQTFYKGSQIHIAYLKNGDGFLINGLRRLNAMIMWWELLKAINPKAPQPSLRFSLLESHCETMEQVHALYYREDTGERRSMKVMVRATDMAGEYDLPEDYVGRVLSATKFIACGFRDAGGEAYDHDDLRELSRQWMTAAVEFYSIAKGAGVHIRKKFYRTPILAVALATLTQAHGRAQSFWARICEDSGLERGDPEKTFLDWFLAQERKNKTLIRNVHLSRAIANAWNAFYKNSKLAYIQVPVESLEMPIQLEGTSFKRKRTEAPKPAASSKVTPINSAPKARLVKKSRAS